jgi:hypothetical protein
VTEGLPYSKLQAETNAFRHGASRGPAPFLVPMLCYHCASRDIAYSGAIVGLEVLLSGV